MYSILAKLFRAFSGTLQWRTLWFFHSKFIIGVSVIAVDSDRRVLLLQHRFWKDKSWGLPSGYAVPGETLEETVRREVREETGLDVEVHQMLRLKSGFKLRIEATFVASIRSSEIRLDSSEILDAQFFDVDALPNELLNSHKELIALYRSTKAPD